MRPLRPLLALLCTSALVAGIAGAAVTPYAIGDDAVLAAADVTAADAITSNAPTTLIVPTPEGGSGSRIARIVADQLAPLLESPVELRFMPGEGGVTAINAMARAPRDGKTLGLALSVPLIAGRLLSRQASYNPIDDFDWLAILGSYGNAIVVRADDPAHTLAEWIANARASKGVRYGTAGGVSAGHLAGEYLRIEHSANLVHVPFTSTVQAYGPLANGDIDALFDGVPSAIVNARPAAFRILAVTSEKRDAALPAIPAFGEIWPGQHFEIWAGVVAPQGLAAAARIRLASTMAVILLDKDLPQKLRDIGFTFIGRGGADASRYVRDEMVRQAALIARLSISTPERP